VAYSSDDGVPQYSPPPAPQSAAPPEPEAEREPQEDAARPRRTGWWSKKTIGS
jgi:hypothetical protein